MSVRERKPFVGGNWKMNGSYESIDAIIKFLSEGNLSPNIGHFIQLKKTVIVLYSADVVVAPPSAYLAHVRQKLPNSIGVSAQNCYKCNKGAFTGEIR